MDSEYSSDTFTDNEENQFSQNSSNGQIEQLKMQNERLQTHNNQLQKTLENVKQQLQEALQYKSSIEQMGENIQALNDKIKETTEQNVKFSKEIQIKQAKLEQLEKGSNEIIEKLTNDKNEALKNNQKLSEKLSKIKNERDNYINESEDKNSVIDALQKQVVNAQKKKKKQSEKIQIFAEKNQELQLKVAQLEIENQKLGTENKTFLQEIEDLKLQIGTQKAISEGNENAISTLNEDIKSKIKGIQQFEGTIKQQKTEIEELIEQRDKLVTLLQKMHVSLCRSEEALAAVQQERDMLRQKSSKTEKQFKIQDQMSTAENSFLQKLNIPFEGELCQECQKIMKYEHYQVQQRIQIMLNEAAKSIQKLKNESNELKNNNKELSKVKEDKEKEANLYKEMLLTLLKDMKSIVINETQISKMSGVKEDRLFIAYVASKCAELDPLIKDNDSSNNKYIPSYFFFSEDVNERVKTIQSLLQPNDETLSLFVTQFLINAQLKKQLSRALESVPVQANIDEVLASIGLKSVDEVPEFVEKIQQQLTKMKNQRSSIRKALKQAQQAIMQQNKASAETQSQVDELKLSNDALTNERDVLKVRNQVLSNDLLIKENEVKSLKGKLELQEKTFGNSAIDQLQAEIESKKAEIDSLKSQIKQLKVALDGAASIQARALKRQESSYQDAINNLQDQLLLMASDNEKKKAKNKKLIRAIQQKHEASISELSSQYEESKQQFNKSIAEMREKTKESQEMSQKLVVSLQESEKKVQSLLAENNKLQTSVKALEIKLTSAQEKLTKEKQNAQSQIAAQSLMNESKVQERVLQIKSEINAQKNALLNLAGRTIGSVYGVDAKTLDEQSFEQLVQQAQKDLEKLRVFQSTPPTYSHI